MIELEPGTITIAQIQTLYWEKPTVSLAKSCRKKVTQACEQVARAAKSDRATYGINTGFGKLASIKIDAADTVTLQKNLILSHCTGIGKPLEGAIVRLMMIIKLLSLARGASGARWELIELLTAMINKDIVPLIPEKGSVGASGDLAPLAHLAAVMIGVGRARYRGQQLSAQQALQQAGLKPIVLIAKEGLALINGTQFSCALALVGLFQAWRAAQNCLITSALSTDAIMGSTQSLHPTIHQLRGHKGQIDVAEAMTTILSGSEIRDSHIEGDTRVQDPYCIRCQPQVTGSALDVLRQASKTLTIEANAVTDNPLVLLEEDIIISGGNFHAEPVGFAADITALAIAEIGAIAQRRVALLVDPNLSYDLPPFLVAKPGLNSGYMCVEITSAALMSENKHLANPCVTDSTPTSANQEDHVSMAAHGARRLLSMTENLYYILAIELLCATQGIEFRAPLKTSISLQKVIAQVREEVPSIQQDCYMADYLKMAKNIVAEGKLLSQYNSILPTL